VTECSFLGWANLIILTITGGVIAWYTLETWKLRKESQLQTELQVRPFLSVACHNVGAGDPAVLIVNIGNGLARNVRIEPVVLDWTEEVRADLITHIAAGAEEIAPWKVWVRLTPADPIGEVPSDQHQTMAGLALTSNDVTVVMRYLSIVGQRYKTTVCIREGVAEIESDEREI
jgi:hypothetical protein